MLYKQRLSPVTLSDLSTLCPGRKLDRLIAQNVLRCRWHTHFHWEPDGPRDWHWCNSKLYFDWGGFKPSTNKDYALSLIEPFVDEYYWSATNHVRFELSIQGKKHWTARTVLIALGKEREIIKYGGKDLALSICLVMLGTYIMYGPKDYSNGWISEVDELPTERSSA